VSTASNNATPHLLLLPQQEEVDAIHSKISQILNDELEASKSYVPKKKDWLASHWEGFMSPAQLSRIRNTGRCYSVAVAPACPLHVLSHTCRRSDQLWQLPGSEGIWALVVMSTPA
jgi:hypothetical protein